MDESPAAKRPRLSMACNECRRRKVRCDTAESFSGYPKCCNCQLRNDVCITTDPRRPEVQVTREWIDSQESINPRQATYETATSSTNEPAPGPSPREASDHVSPWSSRPFMNQSSYTTTAQSVTTPDTAGISPAQQPFDMAFNTDSSPDRIKMLGGSSSQCLMKSFDIYLKSARLEPLSQFFRHGMRQAEEMEIPLVSSPPDMPGLDLCNSYLNTFFDKIHPLYPVFDVDSFRQSAQHLSTLSNLRSLHFEQVPILVSTYLVFSIAADEQAKKLTDDGTRYLHAAAGLLGQVILIPYLPAVQAMILFTLVYRGRNKDGIGWQTLGIAIRIAHTLGLHRHSAKSPDQHGVQSRMKQLYHARIWAILCSLEKLKQLESGRPASIESVDRDQMMDSLQRPKSHNFLYWHMGLAQYQGLINQHVYGHKPGDRTAQQIFFDTATLDRALLSWAQELPEEFRPGNDLVCPPNEFHIAAFLSIQYYQTTIALHRAALIAPAFNFNSEVANHCADDSFRLRLQAGEGICVSSARSIARISLELSDRNSESRIFTAGPPLLACIVLGISLMKNPGNRMVATDLELLGACSEYTAEQFIKSGHNAKFVEGVKSIYYQVRKHVDRISKRRGSVSTRLDSRLEGSGHDIADPWKSVSTPREVYPIPNNSQSGSNKPYQTETLHNQAGTGTSHQLAYPPSASGEGGDLTYGMIPNQYEGSVSDGMPFQNLNVQELWDWMGDMDGQDLFGTQGSYTTQASYNDQ